MKRKALGKGLSSLIPATPPPIAKRSAAEDGSSTGLLQIDLDRIRPNREQPRQDFDAVQLEELAQSIREQGLLQPVVVRRSADDTYELIAGERRWRAAQAAGLLKIPAIVKSVSDDHLLELALIENLQREQLNPLEEARAYQTLIDDLDLTQQEVAEKIGKQRATVANALRLLNLSPEVQELIRSGKLAAGHAKALVSVTKPADQIALARRISADGLSVRQAEMLAARWSRSALAPHRARSARQRDPNVEAAEETLQKALRTRVRIVPGRKGGRMELHYFSDEELERLYQLVLSAAKRS